jgi:hypothetical protein
MAAREALLNREIERVLEKAAMLRMEDKTAEALDLIEKGLANPNYAVQKTSFFTEKIQLLLALNRDAAACEAVLAAWKTDPASARAVYGTIQTYYQQMNRHADVRAWCQKLRSPDVGLPPDLRDAVLKGQFTASLAMADETAACADLSTLFTELKPADAVPFVQQALNGLIDANQHTFAAALLRHLGEKGSNIPLYRDMMVSLTLRCALAAKDWKQAPAAFDACIAHLPDDQLNKVIRSFFSVLQKNDKNTLIEQTSKKVIFNAPSKTNSANYAARVWVEIGVAANRGMLPERLDALLNANISPVQVGNIFDRHFYEMTEHLDIIRNLCAVGERILANCSDENTRNAVKVKVLDGAFITENYDLAVQMLEQGIPGKDKAWHDMSLPKVKAHRAMAQNNPRDAIGFFRDFMNAWIVSDQQEEFDPTSGIAYSREWILGRNAKRIADILDTIPDKAEADKARAESRAYFKTALEKAANDPEALRLLTAETRAMGL